MKTNKTILVSLVAGLALLIVSLACNLPVSNLAGSEGAQNQNNPGDPALQPTAGLELSPNSVTVTLTEGQINTMILQALQGNPEQSIQSLQVRLLEGEAILTGKVSQDGFNLPLELALLIAPDGAGGLRYEITSASVGPLPLPSSLRSEIETSLNQNLKQQVSELTNNIFIESVTISNGVMSVSGRPQ